MKIVSTPYTLYNREIRDPLIRELYNPKVKIVFMTIYRGNIESTLKTALLDALSNGKKLFIFIETSVVGSKKANEELAELLKENGAFVSTNVIGKKYRVHAKCFLTVESQDNVILSMADIDGGKYIISTGNWDSSNSEDIHVLGDYKYGRYQSDDIIYKSLLYSFLVLFPTIAHFNEFNPAIIYELKVSDDFRSSLYKMRPAKEISKEIAWMIDHASKKIYIKCPLISDKNVIISIANAVERGVDVRILTKERPDKIYKMPAVDSDIRGLVQIRKDDDTGWIHKHSRFIVSDGHTAIFTCNLVDSKRIDSYLDLGYNNPKCIIGYDKHNFPVALTFRNYFWRRFKEAKQEYWFMSNSKEWTDIQK